MLLHYLQDWDELMSSPSSSQKCLMNSGWI
jgi:hypothetical protein